MKIENLRKELKKRGNKNKAQFLSRFFKTGKGEYAEGDIFIGVTVPESRVIANKYSDISIASAKKLLESKIHEERLVALLILISKYEKGNKKDKNVIYKIYLSNTKNINSWDLVDISAHKIVGIHLWHKETKVLTKLAHSKNLWERRIAILSTFYFIKQNSYDETLRISNILLNDSHDLIHKAVGWMLREVGKKSLKKEEDFLKKHYFKMPRTMLRYAIERFPEIKRKKYLLGKM